MKITEADFLRQIRDLARITGWATFHPFLSRWSEGGWPDVALCRPPRLLLVELKSDSGKLSPDQERWAEMLRACPGVEYAVWRPSDLNAIAKALAR